MYAHTSVCVKCLEQCELFCRLLKVVEFAE